jgi:hypothetical protein
VKVRRGERVKVRRGERVKVRRGESLHSADTNVIANEAATFLSKGWECR